MQAPRLFKMSRIDLTTEVHEIDSGKKEQDAYYIEHVHRILHCAKLAISYYCNWIIA